MIVFADWRLIGDKSILARQYDNLSRELIISGDIPDGYTWDLLVQVSGYLNIIRLAPMDSGIGVVLTADMLAVNGTYTLQLRGTLQSDGVTVRHTNKISVTVAGSLSGVAQWPEIPSEFVQMEQRREEINSHPPEPGPNGYWTIWDPDKDEYIESDIPLPEGSGYAIGDGLKIVDGKLTVDTAAEVEEDNTKPVTSGAVYVQLGNVEALLANI